jgi:anti-sigma-K factor RskA
MNCIECQEIISDYVDGALELGEQTKLEHHLANCEPCRAVRDDLLQIVHFSKQLPLHTPTSDLWSRIQSEIEAEQPKTIWSRAKVWWNHLNARDFNVTIPRLAATLGAFVIVLAIGAAVLNNASINTPKSAPAILLDSPNQIKLAYDDPKFQEYEKRINELKESVEQRKDSWGPELRISFERNMVYVDQSLNDCRQQLTSNPADEAIRELLKNAYSEKIRVLDGFAKF